MPTDTKQTFNEFLLQTSKERTTKLLEKYSQKQLKYKYPFDDKEHENSQPVSPFIPHTPNTAHRNEKLLADMERIELLNQSGKQWSLKVRLL